VRYCEPFNRCSSVFGLFHNVFLQPCIRLPLTSTTLFHPTTTTTLQLPCDALGQPLFAKSVDPNELWPMLIEKAYAKLHTCYQVRGHTHVHVLELLMVPRSLQFSLLLFISIYLFIYPFFLLLFFSVFYGPCFFVFCLPCVELAHGLRRIRASRFDGRYH
jgi:hypothetical protein